MPMSDGGMSLDPFAAGKEITGMGQDVMGMVKTGYDIYDSNRKFGLQKDEWGQKKQKMQQDYIKQQRDLDWQSKFRDLMLGLPAQTTAVK
jgi:hypothetical protein